MKIKKELTYYTNKNRFPKEVLEFSLLICISQFSPILFCNDRNLQSQCDLSERAFNYLN